MTDVTIRPATPDDAETLLAIYAPYVRDTAISFELAVPSVAEFRERIVHTLQKYPYLVAECDGTILGYAYAGAFKARAAYDWAAEVSIYVKMNERHGGIGGKLYAALEAALRKMGILNANACITYPVEANDAYLTKNSAQFHEHMGYTLVGTFHHCGYKFGRWYNMIWMEKMLGDHTASPAKVVPFNQL